MELRDIEIFLTLAEELHFGRTAERLRVSQARVSQSIAKQERRIGAALFERTSRHVALTPIGEQLRADLEAGQRFIRDGIEAATAAARGHGGILTLGLMGAQINDIAPITGLFQTRHPNCELRIREITFSDPFGPLRAGEVDLQLIWLPVREPDLTVGPVVFAVARVLAVSTRHALAGRDSVCLEDLGDHIVLRSTLPIPAYWEEANTPMSTPSGRPIARGPVVATWEDCLSAVASGEAVCPAGAQVIKHYQRPGLKYLPIDDAPVQRWGLVWRTADETTLIRGFAQAVRDAPPITFSES